jgi:hypothetical protein
MMVTRREVPAIDPGYKRRLLDARETVLAELFGAGYSRARNIGEVVTCGSMLERESGRRAWRTDCACEPFACAYVRPSSLPHSASPVPGEGDR